MQMNNPGEDAPAASVKSEEIFEDVDIKNGIPMLKGSHSLENIPDRDFFEFGNANSVSGYTEQENSNHWNTRDRYENTTDVVNGWCGEVAGNTLSSERYYDEITDFGGQMPSSQTTEGGISVMVDNILYGRTV